MILKTLTNWLQTLASPMPTLVVGYSGGRDSHVLLHALAQLSQQYSLKLKAIHVNHQLNPNAESWVNHCQNICQALNIEYQALTINLNLQPGESLEAKARDKRYQAIAAQLKPDEILLTAHTQDDQAETFLLQLMRGSGVRGLSAMPAVKPLANSLQYRPLLSVSRAAINNYSMEHKLESIEDNSNQDLTFDRNFIRHEILPKLEVRFKGVKHCIARSAKHCQTAYALEQIIAKADLQGQSETLNPDMLKSLSNIRQKNAIRFWLQQNCLNPPSEVKLMDIMHQMFTARADKAPEIAWPGGQVKRYKKLWYAFKPNILQAIDITAIIPWCATKPIKLPCGKMLKPELLNGRDKQNLTIRYRQGGERCKPTGKRHSKPLKKWLQEYNVPIWQRQYMPLIYQADQLIIVPEVFSCD